MSRYVLSTIVEGFGEVEAVPILLGRLSSYGMAISRPIRVKRQRIVQEEELAHYARIAESNIVEAGGLGGVLLLMDADDDCAASVGPELESRLQQVLPHRRCHVVLPVRNYESWLAGGVPEIGFDAPDERANCKSRIRQFLGNRYSETADQPKLTARIDLSRLSQISRSFQRLRRVMDSFTEDSERPD